LLLALGTACAASAQEPDWPHWPHSAPHERAALPEPLVYLRDIDRTIVQDMRYAGPDNFTGRPVPGYGASECVLLREAAEALARVQQRLLPRKLSLKVYDCYRPRRAVRAFVAWVKEGESVAADPLLKRFHPNTERSRLIEQGYIAAVSGHSRGDTVDLTLVELPAKHAAPFGPDKSYGPCTGPATERAPDSAVDMGTAFDCFDALSRTDAPQITPAQRRWRQILVEAMAREGFDNYRKEWWHFTLMRASGSRAFNVPIGPRQP
jgi:D-alanyl-D-alanine dipeptidase